MTTTHMYAMMDHVTNMLEAINTTNNHCVTSHKAMRLSTKLVNGPFKEMVININGTTAEYCDQHPDATVEDAMDEIMYVGRFMRNGVKK